MITREEIEEMCIPFRVLAEPIPVQEKGKNEDEKMNEKYGLAAKIKTTAERVCGYAKANMQYLRKGTIGITIFSLPFLGTYAAYTAQSNILRQEFVKAEEKIAEKNQQIENKIENLIEKNETLKSEKKTVLVFDDVSFYKCSYLAKPCLDEAIFWYQAVFPSLTLGEKISFCRGIDTDNDYFVSVDEAKKFLDKIKNKYEKEVREVWKELKK